MEEFMPTPITEKPVVLTDSNSELSKIYIGKKLRVFCLLSLLYFEKCVCPPSDGWRDGASKGKKSEAAEKEVALVVVHVKDLAKLGRRKGPSSPALKVLPGNWVVMPHLEKEAFFQERSDI